MIGSAVVSWSNTWCQSTSSSSSTKLCMLLSVNILVFMFSTCLYLVLMLKFRAANIAIWSDIWPYIAWNCHLHPSLRFSGSSNHLIHAFLAVASLGNLCQIIAFGYVRNTASHVCFCFGCQCRPLQTHQYFRRLLPGNYMISELFASMSLVRHNAQTHDSSLATITT